MHLHSMQIPSKRNRAETYFSYSLSVVQYGVWCDCGIHYPCYVRYVIRLDSLSISTKISVDNIPLETVEDIKPFTTRSIHLVAFNGSWNAFTSFYERMPYQQSGLPLAKALLLN